MAQVVVPKSHNEFGDVPLAAPETESNKFDFMGMLSRRKWLIVLGVIVGLSAGALYYSKAPVEYATQTRIFIQKQESTATPVLGAEALFPELQFESHAKVIQSDFMVQNVVANLVESQQLEDLDSLSGYGGGSIRAIILSGLTVIPDEDDPNVYFITYRGSNRSDCGIILLEMVQAYREYLDLRTEKIDSELETLIKRGIQDLESDLAWLETKRDYLRGEAINLEDVAESIREDKNLPSEKKDEMIRELQTLKEKRDYISDSNPEFDLILTTEGQVVNYNQDLMNNIQVKVTDLGLERIDLVQELNWIGQQLEQDNNREVLLFILERNQERSLDEGNRLESARMDQREYQSMMALIEMQFQLDEMLVKFGQDHPQVIAQQRKVERMLEQISLITGGATAADSNKPVDILQLYVRSLQERVNTIDSRLGEYEKLYASAKDKSQRLVSWQLQDESLARKYERAEATHANLLAKLDELSLQNDPGGYEFEILDPPPEAGQVEPNPLKVFAIAGVLGMLVGLGLAYLVDIADKTYRSPIEITQALQVPLIGHVPIITRDLENDYSDSNIEQTIVTYHRSKSKVAEAYRAVRTAVYFSTNNESHKVIQVTSPSPGDGKTTLASNLAVSIANSGKRVVLVDADMRRPRLHQIFGEDSEIGFAGVLAGIADPSEGIVDTEINNLSLMPCGRRPSNPSELLTSPRLQELIDVLRDQFEYVIVDSPPVLAVTDPCAIAPRVDATLLTFRIKKNVKISSDRAREILMAVGANLLGIVVNGVGTGSPVYGSRYGYGGYGNRNYNYAYSYVYGYGYGLGLDDHDYYDDDEDELNRSTPALAAPYVNGSRTETNGDDAQSSENGQGRSS